MRDLCVCVCTGGNVCLYEYAKKRVQGKRQTKRMGSQMANNFIGRTHTHTHKHTHTQRDTHTHTHTHTHVAFLTQKGSCQPHIQTFTQTSPETHQPHDIMSPLHQTRDFL